MNERIVTQAEFDSVANAPATIYARGRVTFMPAANEGSQDGALRREAKPVSAAKSEPITNGRSPEAQVPQNIFLDSVRGFFEVQPEKPKVHPSVSHENALAGARILAKVRGEVKTTASRDEIRKLEDDLLSDGRIPANVIHGMDNSEIVAAYPILLQNTTIAGPKDADFEFPKGSKKRIAEELETHQLIENASSTGEEEVNPEKVGKHLEVIDEHEVPKVEDVVYEVKRPEPDLSKAIEAETVAISDPAMDAMRDLLKKNGYRDADVAKMSVAQVVVEGHKVTQSLKQQKAERDLSKNTAKKDNPTEEPEHESKSHREEKLVNSELIYKAELNLPGSKIKFPLRIYRKSDGTLVMNKLPPIVYSDEKLMKRILKDAGIAKGKVELPEWKTIKQQEREDLLRDKFGVTTDADGLLYRPEQWGHLNPNHTVNTVYGQFVDEMEFRDLILEKWHAQINPILGPPSPQQQQRAQAVEDQINARIQWNGPQDTSWVVTAFAEFDELKKEARNDPATLAQLDTFLTIPQQQMLEHAKGLADAYYEHIIATQGSGPVADIDSEANQQLGLLNVHYTTIENATGHIMQTTRSKQELPAYQGMRIWYAIKQIELLHKAHDVLKRTEIKTNPLESLRAAEELMRFFEKSKSKEMFDLARGNLVRIIQSVENSNDPLVTPTMKERFRKRFNSFELMNTMLIIADENEGSPDKLHPIALKFDDETWHYFYDRFVADELTDRDGKRYLVDQQGVLINLNLQSELENSIAEMYLTDRWRVNRITELMSQDLQQGVGGQVGMDQDWIIDRITQKINNAGLGVNFNDAWNSAGHIDELGHWVPDNLQLSRIRKEAIAEWYMEQTLLGSDGYDPHSNRQRKDVKLDTAIQTTLRQRLVTAGVAQDRINDLLGTLQNQALPYDQVTNPVTGGDYDLMSTVRRNGYDLAKFKLADTLDRFRLYDRNGLHIDTIWGEDTPYGARMTTHFADWCLNEGQGDLRVVRELLQLMDEKASGGVVNPEWERLGALLAQNNTGFRFFAMRDNTGNQVIVGGNTPLGLHVDNLIDQETNLTGDPTRDVEGYIWTNQLLEGINPNDPNHVNRTFASIDWQEKSKEIKSYPVHDMLDDRQKVTAWYLSLREGLRGFLIKPFPDQFNAMIKHYYSARPEARGYAGAEILAELAWITGQHWEEWFDHDENISMSVFEGMIEGMKAENLISEKRADRLIRKVLGEQPEKTIKELGALGKVASRETVGSPSWWAGSVPRAWKDLLSPFIKYLISSR